MQSSIQNKDIRTLGYVLKRVNYSEADRILSVLTPNGKISVIAKGVRKEKSKLAGNVEMFTLIDFNLRWGRSEFGLVTGAKMIKYYDAIIKDFNKIEFASMMFKEINKAAENTDSAEYFRILDQSLKALNDSINLDMIRIWFLLNLNKVIGEEVNFYRDIDGNKLEENKKYSWDGMEMAFSEDVNGEYGADEIKLLRLIVSNDFDVLKRVKLKDGMIRTISQLVRMVV